MSGHPRGASVEWARSQSTSLFGSHACNCVGCCRLCGTCSTALWHTADYCSMVRRQAAEREAYVRDLTPRAGRPS